MFPFYSPFLHVLHCLHQSTTFGKASSRENMPWGGAGRARAPEHGADELLRESQGGIGGGGATQPPANKRHNQRDLTALFFRPGSGQAKPPNLEIGMMEGFVSARF